MPKTLNVPVQLRKCLDNQETLQVNGNTIGEVVEELEQRYNNVKARLLAQDGTPNKFILFFINDEDIRFLNGVNTQLKDGDVITLIPSIAGG